MPEYAAIKFTRRQGQGITVDEAPARARMDLQVLADRYAYLHMPAPDVIVFADQVVYKVTGYSEGALLLELVEDWRTPATAFATGGPLTEEQYEALKTKWKEQHGNGHAVHPVVVLNEEKQP